MRDDQPLLVLLPPPHNVLEDEVELPSLIMSWSILFAASGMMWGIYFIYDIPASLSTPLQHHLGLSDSQYAYLVAGLYTAYATPNFVLPGLCGFVVHRYGQKRVLMSSLAIAILGQTIFASALQGRAEGRWGLVAGRVFVGIGSEIPGVIASDTVTRWFHGRTLALALAMLLCISRLGSVATSVLTPRLTEKYGVVGASWASTSIAMAVSICCAAYLIFLDRHTIVAEDSKPLALSTYKDSLRRFPRVFWILAIICFASYGCLGPFNNSAQRFLSSRFYEGNERAAGLAVSIPNTLSGVLVLPFGLLLDFPRLNNYPVAIFLSSGLLLTAHLCFLMQLTGPVFPLLLLGIAYGLFGTAFWPAVASCILEAPTGVPDPELLAAFTPKQPSRLAPNISEYSQPAFNSEGAADTSRISADSTFTSAYPFSQTGNEDLLVIGYGLMTSLLNFSMGITPIVLAGMEILAAFTGLEICFVALAGFSLCAAGKLINDWKVKRIT
ncbi:hypothetical protein WAI453_011823 [Rhynchosporium graminicola]|uniref:Lysosomal dipeptide transporter MFSD1 n=1 Tax=Rhynchosporium graminicola TaxID=2792576 RepID=A0A1E1K0P0_9HELO|nr:uncharacterized protein RCO7_06982 [Rhynchosporium commune]